MSIFQETCFCMEKIRFVENYCTFIKQCCLKFYGGVQSGKRNKWLNFGGDLPDHDPAWAEEGTNLWPKCCGISVAVFESSVWKWCNWSTRTFADTSNWWLYAHGVCFLIWLKLQQSAFANLLTCYAWAEHDSALSWNMRIHSTKKPVTTMLTYPWKCTVLHCNHLGNTWKPLVLMTRHFDYCPSASEGDNQSVGSSAPVVSRCFPGGYNVKLYISRGRLAWWLLAFLHSDLVWLGQTRNGFSL